MSNDSKIRRAGAGAGASIALLSAAVVSSGCSTSSSSDPPQSVGGSPPMAVPTGGSQSALTGGSGGANGGAATGGAAADALGGSAGEGALGSEVIFNRQVLSLDFVAEGATFGDFNRDGLDDVVAGSHWYEGPDFEIQHLFRPAAVFDPLGYSDNFFAFAHDFNNDGWQDVLIYGFPGESAAWYENPQGVAQDWTRHEIFSKVDNEAPAFVDLLGDGVPKMVFNSDGYFGWAGPADAESLALYSFQALSAQGDWQSFTHGLGVGDLNGDGRLDVIHRGGFWAQPSTIEGGVDAPWPYEAHDFGGGGAQMLVYDVDGDGDQDLISSLAAHGYGISWFEQIVDAGTRSFLPHAISGTPDSLGPSENILHEPHALTLEDIDGDGLLDIVTGERFWGHVPEERNFDDPALLVWYRLVQGPSGPHYEEHVIDSASGVGTQVVAQRLDDDATPSIVIANKKGVFVFRGR